MIGNPSNTTFMYHRSLPSQKCAEPKCADGLRILQAKKPSCPPRASMPPFATPNMMASCNLVMYMTTRDLQDLMGKCFLSHAAYWYALHTMRACAHAELATMLDTVSVARARLLSYCTCELARTLRTPCPVLVSAARRDQPWRPHLRRHPRITEL